MPSDKKLPVVFVYGVCQTWAALELSPAFSPTSSRDGKAPVRPGVSRCESDAGVYSHFKVDEQRIPLEWRDDLIVVADGW
jgi:hypothetical protein